MAAMFSSDEVDEAIAKTDLPIIQNLVISFDNSIIKCWIELKHRPICICFDLDYTLWPMLIDKDLVPPLRKKKRVENNLEIFDVVDNNNKHITYYEEVPKILVTLKECFSKSKTKHFIAIASKATTYDLAVKLLKMYGWYEYFNSIQIYSGTKIKHMKQIKDELKFQDFKDILFFDDSKSNISQTETLGLTAYQVGHVHGLNVKDFIHGLKKFESQNRENKAKN